MLFATFINFLCFNVIFLEIILSGGQRDMLRLQRSCVSDTCIFELCWCRICLLTATELGVWFYIAKGDFDHCPTWKLIHIVKKIVRFAFIFWLQTNCSASSTNLDTKSLSILRACFVSMSDQWNGDAPCKSLRLLWTENANSLNDGNKTEHQLGWFTQIWGNFSRSKSCKNKQFVQRMFSSPV